MEKNPKVKIDEKALANNCWVLIFEDEGYQDKNLLVSGPARHSNLKNLPNSESKDWGDDIDSLIVGPNCWLQVFADENFSDTSAWYGPNSHVPGLGDMGDEIDSMILYDQPNTAYFDFVRKKYKSSQIKEKF